MQVNGYNINIPHYADDTVLTAENVADLHHMLDIVVKECQKGLSRISRK